MMACCIAALSAFAEYAPLGGPGKGKRSLDVNALSPSALYALRQLSTVMPSLPSIIAMILKAQNFS